MEWRLTAAWGRQGEAPTASALELEAAERDRIAGFQRIHRPNEIGPPRCRRVKLCKGGEQQPAPELARQIERLDDARRAFLIECSADMNFRRRRGLY